MGLERKRVVVVGASAGIGRSFAVQAHEAGADVVVAARRGDRLEQVVGEAGGGLAVTVDVTDRASCDALLTTVQERLGEVDLLLCTVGCADMQLLSTVGEEAWMRTMAVNLVGVNRLVTGVLPMLSTGGVISVLSSETVGHPRNGLVPYAASKAALEVTLKGVRIEHPGTRVSCVVVGATYPTDFGNAFDGEVLGPAMESWARHGLLQQEYMDPDDVAGVLVDLYSTALRHPGVCIQDVVLRSPSPVVGELVPT